jgi:hypothetical protein
MKGADTKVANMNELQLRLRDARKVCADDGYNGKFCQVFNDAIDRIAELEQQRDELLAAAKDAQEFMAKRQMKCYPLEATVAKAERQASKDLLLVL